MRVGFVQMQVDELVSVNLERAEFGVQKAAQEGAKIVVLPEMFCCPYRSDRFIQDAEPQGGPIFERLSQLASKTGVYLVGGSVPELELGLGLGQEQRNIYNTSYIFSDEGACVAKHRKVHLFDVSIPGKISFKESDTLAAGHQITVIETPWIVLGVAICYDLRFPEFFRKMTLAGAELIVVPAAFNMTTGPAHWELLARGRAVDNQVFIGLCSPASVVTDSFVSYGHSLVSDCWGEIVATLDSEPGVLVVELDMERQSEVRKQLPLLCHMRPEIY